ncbi:MAG: LysO family transporter [Cetobacterium sp.]|uniref:LysO family transporter n=1 Tax=Cetobacterium sp. TaxID=2071632 RepID=UPI003F2ADDEB
MLRILLYIFIISCGIFLSKHDLIPFCIKSKTNIFQTTCLFFLLGVMGYKIGSNEQIIREFPQLGLRALIIAILSIVGSVIVTAVFFKKVGDK